MYTELYDALDACERAFESVEVYTRLLKNERDEQLVKEYITCLEKSEVSLADARARYHSEVRVATARGFSRT